MATFDVAAEVDALAFDFTKYVPDAKGDIPEPSNDQLTAFRKVLSESIPLKTGDDGKRAVDFTALAEEVKDDEGAALEARLYGAVSDLCSGTPSVEQIKALPYRGQQAFIGWIIGKFLRPEA